MDTKKIINIACAADEKYKKYLLTTITSVMISAADKYKIIFHIAADDFTDGTISIYEKFITKNGHEIKWLNDISADFDIPLTMYFSRAASIRLFFADMIDRSVDTLIYLDSDIIIWENGLEKLAETDIGNYSIAAVADADHDYKYTSARLEIADDFRYFNSGVMIINLKKWREQNATQKHIDILIKKREKLLYVDQDVLNCCWMNDIYYLPVKFNVTSANYAFPAKFLATADNKYYCIDEINEAIKNPCILHFYGYRINRPWKKACYHPKKNEYIKFADLSPFPYELEKTSVKEIVKYTWLHIFGYREAIVTRKFYSLLSNAKKFALKVFRKHVK